MLDELTRLLEVATPGPWRSPKSSGRLGVVFGKRSQVAVTSNRTDDADLIAAAVNALPGLLRLARAVAAEHAAMLAVNDERDGARLRAALDAHTAAHREVVAALEALQ